MANLYVASTGSNTSPYDTWAKAATAPLTATALAAAGDTIYMHGETFTIAADATYVLAAGVRWLCTNDKTNEPPLTASTAGVINGSGTASVDIAIQGGPALVDGITFQNGASSVGTTLAVANTDGSKITLRNCLLRFVTAAPSANITLGFASSSGNSEVVLQNTSLRFNNVGQGVNVSAHLEANDSVILASGSSVPTTLFKPGQTCGLIRFGGCDFSGMSSGTVFANNASNYTRIELSQCKQGAATLNASLTSAGTEIFVYDCASGDQHYQFQHQAYNGSTTISTSIYADDGAAYDIAGTKHSWVVAGNANTSKANPYVSPWISRYNEGVAAVTPYLEVLRNSSTTAYTDVEVWAEFMAKTAGGSPISALVSSDFGGNLSGGTNQASGAASWTGTTTPWVGKLSPASTITPAEIGHIQARVCVTGNLTLYVDPQIRGV